MSNVVTSGVHPLGAEHPFEAAERERYRDPLLMAHGAMGRVSAVTDTRLMREVAVKEVHPDDEDTPGLERRLVQEAWITAQLEHPGIVPIYDAGKGKSGRLFFTMRLIRGRSLAAALASRSLDLATLLRHFLAVCQAMGYAHARGVVHRDLKPANIMLGEFGETQIVDWGVARAVDAGRAPTADHDGAPSVPSVQGAAATSAGVRVGTPAYMSPEQARALPGGRPSDVWSLGAILFEIIAGRPMWDGVPTREIYRRLALGALPRLDEVAPSASPELAAVVRRALAVDPAGRYPDARALAADVAAYLDGRRVGAYAYSAWDMAKRFGRTFRVPLVVAAVALVTIAVVFALSYAQTLDERDRSQAAEAAASAARDRAIASERRATQARDAAARSYAELLVQRAREAQRNDAQVEAELLAAHALVRAPSPEARGVLARFGASARVVLRQLDVAPDCTSSALSPRATHLVCIEDDATSLWSIAPLALVWRVPAPFDAATFISESQVLVADLATAAEAMLDVETGALLPLRVPLVASRVNAAAGVVLGDDGGTRLTIWRAATNTATTLEAPMREPRAMSGDGQVALAYDEATLSPVLIDVAAATSRPMPPLPFSAQGPISAALDHAGARAAFGGTRGELIVVAVDDGALVWRERVTERALTQTSWSPDDRWLAVRDERGWVSIHDVAGRTRLALPRTRATHMAWRTSVRVGPDAGLELVVVGDHIGVYGVPATPRAVAIHTATGIASLALDARGDRVALPEGSGDVGVYEVASGVRVGELLGDGRAVAKHAAFVPDDGDTVAVVWPGRTTLGVWRPGREAAVQYRDIGTNYRRVVAAAHGELVAAGYGASVFVFPDGAPRREQRVHDGGSPIDLVASPDGRVVAWLSSRGGIEVVVGDGHRLGAPRTTFHAPGATRIALSGDGLVLAAARPEEIVVVTVPDGRASRVIAVPGARVSEVALSRDGALLAAGTMDGEVMVWEPGGALRLVGAGHVERVSGLAFGPDGDWVLSAGWDRAALRWDLTDRGAESPLARVERLERTWGVGLEHAARVDLR